MTGTSHLPALNAALNAAAAVLLVAGWGLIRHRRWRAHRAVMLSALAVSLLFLTSYLTYHYRVGTVRFQGQGTIHAIYMSILLSHTLLAAAAAPLVLATLRLAWRGRFDAHRRLARWTLPVWLYVSVTGVVVYWMLYRL